MKDATKERYVDIEVAGARRVRSTEVAPADGKWARRATDSRPDSRRLTGRHPRS